MYWFQEQLITSTTLLQYPTTARFTCSRAQARRRRFNNVPEYSCSNVRVWLEYNVEVCNKKMKTELDWTGLNIVKVTNQSNE